MLTNNSLLNGIKQVEIKRHDKNLNKEKHKTVHRHYFQRGSHTNTVHPTKTLGLTLMLPNKLVLKGQVDNTS